MFYGKGQLQQLFPHGSRRLDARLTSTSPSLTLPETRIGIEQRCARMFVSIYLESSIGIGVRPSRYHPTLRCLSSKNLHERKPKGSSTNSELLGGTAKS